MPIYLKGQLDNQSEATLKTYSYAIDEWYFFSKTGPEKRWKLEPLQKRLTEFVNSRCENELNPRTISKVISAMKYLFRDFELRWDIIRQPLTYYQRRTAIPVKKANPIGIEELRLMVKGTERWRDRTILTVGWAGALRAGEIIQIRRNHLRKVSDGFELKIPRSKTDQLGKGKTIALPYFHMGYQEICPARHLDHWLLRQLELFDTLPTDDRLFEMTVRNVSRIVERAGKNAELPERYSSHSLRRGLATTAARHGVADRQIMRHGRWLSREVVDGYIEEGTLWSKTALDFLR